MPDLPKDCTAVPIPPAGDPNVSPIPDPEEEVPEVAIPPIVAPADFTEYEVFRETFLCRFTLQKDNAALRTVARLFHEMTCELQHFFPDAPEGDVRTLLRATIADLRYLQGSLALTAAEIEKADDFTPIEEHHARLAGRMAEKVREIADTLEADLGAWRGEEV